MTSRGQFPKDTGSQRDFISPVRDDVTRRNRRRGWIGLEGKFWLKDGRVGHRWDFCQRVSRKIARLVKKLLLVEAASFATYIFRTRPSFSYFSLSFPLSPSYDPFSPRFSRENGKLVRLVVGGKKHETRESFPRFLALFHRVFVSHSRNFAPRMARCFRASLE